MANLRQCTQMLPCLWLQKCLCHEVRDLILCADIFDVEHLFLHQVEQPIKPNTVCTMRMPEGNASAFLQNLDDGLVILKNRHAQSPFTVMGLNAINTIIHKLLLAPAFY